MFRKIISNLPFSPSLISQVSFYSKRLKKEEISRRVGLIFAVFMVLVQAVTYLAPAKPTLAASNNDIIFGGNGKNKSGIIEAYFKNMSNPSSKSGGSRDIQAIFNHYGIYAQQLHAAKAVSIYSSAVNNYWSIGRNPRGYGGEVAVNITGAKTSIYSRTLHGWAANKSWSALEVSTDKGKRWILLECGNIITQESAKPDKPTVQPEKPDTPIKPVSSSSKLELGKLAQNITRSVENAHGTTAQAGDTIEYTLRVKNTGTITKEDFVVEENLSDVLEYADVIDATGATFSENPVKMLSWQPVDIKPGQTVDKTFLVKIKGTIPNTPASSSDPLSYDLKLANRYGDTTVVINLPKTTTKLVEQTVSTLPSTGFGANAGITAVFITLVTYFYFRSRLMVKELVIVKQEFGEGV